VKSDLTGWNPQANKSENFGNIGEANLVKRLECHLCEDGLGLSRGEPDAIHPSRECRRLHRTLGNGSEKASEDQVVNLAVPETQAGWKVMLPVNINKKQKRMKKLVILTVMVAVVGLMSARAEDAKVIYEKECTKCHGADGKGNTKMGKKSGVKDYTDAKVQAELKPDKAFKAIKEGMKEGDKTLMKPFDTLSDEEIKALVKYMQGFKK